MNARSALPDGYDPDMRTATRQQCERRTRPMTGDLSSSELLLNTLTGIQGSIEGLRREMREDRNAVNAEVDAVRSIATNALSAASAIDARLAAIEQRNITAPARWQIVIASLALVTSLCLGVAALLLN